MHWNVFHGDCRDVMRSLPPDSVDAIVSDPPYGLSFMGKEWDHGVPGVEFWTEALRVAKPGAHLLAFGGTRTFHRLAVAIEDAGWEMRDCVMWVYGSGFPKSHDVSKAIDKAAGVERKVVGTRKVTDSDLGQSSGWNPLNTSSGVYNYTAPATDAAKAWQGWGTALKPAWEPIIVARKPLIGTVAENVLTHGTGALNVDGCRVAYASDADFTAVRNGVEGGYRQSQKGSVFMASDGEGRTANKSGRWPANVIHDGSEEVVAEFPNDAARFFYCAKTSKAEREAGLDGMPARIYARSNGAQAAQDRGELYDPNTVGLNRATITTNNHPTVKPIALMRYLCRLVTPPGGLVLDPFNGSGSTGCAAVLEGFRYLGCELEAEYVEIAKRRIAYWEAQRASGDLFDA